MSLVAKEIKTFVPAGRDYETSLRFYEELGFKIEWKSPELALLAIDQCRFFLQNLFVEEMQRNFMMSLDVEDLDAWWAHLTRLDLEKRYPGTKLRAPEDYPWGMREIHLIDAAGVLWHIAVPSKPAA
jgi:uncharacterized glyoxalase superfamily protein PhnB